MTICYRCSQPITMKSTMNSDENGTFHMGTEIHRGKEGSGYLNTLGCPIGDDQVLANMKIAMDQGFKPMFR